MSDRIPESPLSSEPGSGTGSPRSSGPRNPFVLVLFWTWVVGFSLGLLVLIIGNNMTLAYGYTGSVDSAGLVAVTLWLGNMLVKLAAISLFVHLGVKAVLWRAP